MTKPLLDYAKRGGVVPLDMNADVDRMRINRGLTWDDLVDDMAGPSREQFSNARSGAFGLSPAHAWAAVRWLFAELGLPEPDAPDPLPMPTYTMGSPTDGSARPGLPAEPPSGEGGPTHSRRGDAASI